MIKKGAFLLVIFLFSFFSMQAQWVQLGQDIDGEAEGDESGKSVSLSSDGTIVAIGAPVNDGNGFWNGHVRVYQNINGTWMKIGEDIDGEGQFDFSGSSVSLNSDGSIVAIGAAQNDGNGIDAGHVRIYHNNIGIWEQLGQDIDGKAAGDLSGYSVSLSSDGSIVAIGAPLINGIDTITGYVRIYQYNDGIWTQKGQDINGEAAGDIFGSSISLSADGSVVAIGAQLNGGNGIEAGHVRIYQITEDIWTQIGQDIDGEDAGDRSGSSVNLSSDGSIVAIGAVKNIEMGSWGGHVRVYQNIDGNWIQLGQDIDAESAGDRTGSSLDLNSDGSVLAIGAIGNSGNGFFSGSVRIYRKINETWIQTGQDIDGEASGDRSGKSVSLNLDGSVVAIGAYVNSDNGSQAGHVRVYEDISLVGLSNFSKPKISIYPNPTKGIIQLKLIWNTEPQVFIYDITGKLINNYQISINNNQLHIDMVNFRNGVYLIEIIVDNEVYRNKIMKK
jgi:hypothetical protein